MSNNGMNGSAFFFVHTTTDLPKTSPIHRRRQQRPPSPRPDRRDSREPVRILSVPVG
jgi:hypothetical protein